ncbi:MAG: hypothetical protein GC200_10090 [Tepidisphaera sp.]|nr:hypothetical protein [Tepidisphaera sp.]
MTRFRIIILRILLPSLLGVAAFFLVTGTVAGIYVRNSGVPARFLAGPGGVLWKLNRASVIRTKYNWMWQCREKISFGINLGSGDGFNLSPDSPGGAEESAKYEARVAASKGNNRQFFTWRPEGWEMMEPLAIRGKGKDCRIEWWSVGWPFRSFWMISTFPNGHDPVYLAGSPNTALDGVPWIPESILTELHSLPGLPTGIRWWALFLDLFVFAGGMVVLFNARLGYRLGVRAIRRRRRQCVQCGYPRDRLPANSRCPECGYLDGSANLPAGAGSSPRGGAAEHG